MHPCSPRVLLLVAICFIWCPVISQEQDTTGQEQAVRNSLEKELFINTVDSMARAAEFWHSLEIKAATGKLDTHDENTVGREIHSIDSSNLVALKTLFTLYGFPGIKEYGKKTCRDYTYLLQRSGKDPKFQEKALQAMRSKVDEGNASASDFAYLMDQVRMNTHGKQLYGTQVTLNDQGTGLAPRPVESPEFLDERRSEIGLGSIENYLKMMNDRYGFK